MTPRPPFDPAYTPAAALVGWCRVLQRSQGWGALSDQDIGDACRLARQVLEAERDDAETIGQATVTLFRLAGERPGLLKRREFFRGGGWLLRNDVFGRGLACLLELPLRGGKATKLGEVNAGGLRV